MKRRARGVLEAAWLVLCAISIPVNIFSTIGYAVEGHPGRAGLSAALTGLYGWWLARAWARRWA